MRRSREDAAETREQILATASEMFLERGIGSVGVRDIMSATGLTQGAFYGHFESKEQLIAEAIKRAFDRLFVMFESEISGRPAAESVLHVVSLYLKQAQSGRPGSGEAAYLCPLSTLGTELSHADPKVRAISIEGYERLVRFLATLIQDLALPSPLVVARSIVNTMVGAVTLAGIAMEEKAANVILRSARASIEAQLSPVRVPRSGKPASLARLAQKGKG